MRWTINDEGKPFKPFPQIGDHKIVKRFCLFPKSHYDTETKTTTYYWLESVYVTYEWVQEYMYCTPWGSRDIEPAHWKKIDISTSEKFALDKLWNK